MTKIVFMGTPAFAVPSLKILIENQYDVVAVVTVPDKPAGRGLQLKESEVKKYAKEHGLLILQPEKMKEEAFVEKLREIKPDLSVVVAFRMLPKLVWSIPKWGTFNLHSSLLPQYRGAAPINWAIINGEKETGVSTFLIDEEIDTGNILLREMETILEEDNAGSLHDRLMMKGAELVLKTVKEFEKGQLKPVSQEEFIPNGTELKVAPKIHKEDCKIDWNNNKEQIRNFIRGLSPYPGAFTELKNENNALLHWKIYACEVHEENFGNPGQIKFENGKIFVQVNNGSIEITEIQAAGKKRMFVEEYLRGFKNTNSKWEVF